MGESDTDGAPSRAGGRVERLTDRVREMLRRERRQESSRRRYRKRSSSRGRRKAAEPGPSSGPT
jgi:hypothetical protein